MYDVRHSAHVEQLPDRVPIVQVQVLEVSERREAQRQRREVVASKVQFLQFGEPGERRGHGFELSLDFQLLQVPEVSQLLGYALEAPIDAQGLQVPEQADGARNRLQFIIISLVRHVQVFKACEVADGVGKGQDVVVVQIQNLEVLQVPDFGREVLKLVAHKMHVGQSRDLADFSWKRRHPPVPDRDRLKRRVSDRGW